jgi:hypothetical protein
MPYSEISMELLKVLLLTGAIFIPLERLLPIRSNKRFAQDWLNDLFY